MKESKYIDHTLLKPEATKAQIVQLCEDAVKNDFASVCINPYWVKMCAQEVKDSDVLVCTVVGFPLGANTTATKVYETKEAISNGADEIDMVINIGALKGKEYDVILEDIKAIVEAASDHVVKVIIETSLLSDDEIIKASQLAKEAKATFVKTSTGFSTGGATKEDVALMAHVVGSDLGVKASGGIKTREDFLAMIKAGATRIGTSNGMALLKDK